MYDVSMNELEWAVWLLIIQKYNSKSTSDTLDASINTTAKS